jgi:hypothetical protein
VVSHQITADPLENLNAQTIEDTVDSPIFAKNPEPENRKPNPKPKKQPKTSPNQNRPPIDLPTICTKIQPQKAKLS